MHIKHCEYCNKQFETENCKKRFCSPRCSNKFLWLDPSYRERMSKIQKEIQNRPQRKQITKRKSIQWWSNQQNRNKMCKIQKQIHNTDQMKSKTSKFQKQYKNRPNVKAHLSKKQKQWLSKQQNLISMKRAVTEAMNRPEVKQKISKSQIQRFKDPKNKQYLKKPKSEIFKLNHSRCMLDKWKNDQYVSHKHSGFFKRKDYKLLSGKIVKIQGNENLYLDQFFNTGGIQSDILIEDIDIKNGIGIINYVYEGKVHRYFPDFYIISQNKIVEVKSKWTYSQHKQLTDVKLMACNNLGYVTELKIY